jgi:hypothetical protein
VSCFVCDALLCFCNAELPRHDGRDGGLVLYWRQARRRCPAGAERCARHCARVVLAQHKRRGCHCPRQPDAVRYGNKQGGTMTFLADAVGTGRCQIVERCTVRRMGAQHEG